MINFMYLDSCISAKRKQWIIIIACEVSYLCRKPMGSLGTMEIF